jgi:NADH dehydrogenase FAD-containing subunit
VLQGLSSKEVGVVLVDRTNHHVFQPLLYQVAPATLSTGEIAQPIRSISLPPSTGTPDRIRVGAHQTSVCAN